METVIMICLLLILVLLLEDKLVIYKPGRRHKDKTPELPDIMGLPKPVQRHAVPMEATPGQPDQPKDIPDNFEAKTKANGFARKIPQEALDEVFEDMPDLEEEEAEWIAYGPSDSDNGFATGVTFDELSTAGAWLQQETPEPALQEKAVDIVQRVQGTELFSLLESSMEGASRKMAALLDKHLPTEADSDASDLRNDDLRDFDIGEFV